MYYNSGNGNMDLCHTTNYSIKVLKCQFHMQQRNGAKHEENFDKIHSVFGTGINAVRFAAWCNGV